MYQSVIYFPPPRSALNSQTVYNYPVLREALNVMSQPPAAPDQNGGQGGTSQLPLLLMRTVMVSVGNFAELKNFVATAVLPRLVQQKVKCWSCRNDILYTEGASVSSVLEHIMSTSRRCVCEGNGFGYIVSSIARE